MLIGTGRSSTRRPATSACASGPRSSIELIRGTLALESGRPVGRPDEPRARRPPHRRAPSAGLAEPAALRLPGVPRAARTARRTAVRPAVVSAEPGRGRLGPQHEHRQPHGGAGLPGARASQVLDDRWTADGRLVVASTGPSAPWSASGGPGSARWRCARSPRCTATRPSYRWPRDARSPIPRTEPPHAGAIADARRRRQMRRRAAVAALAILALGRVRRSPAARTRRRHGRSHLPSSPRPLSGTPLSGPHPPAAARRGRRPRHRPRPSRRRRLGIGPHRRDARRRAARRLARALRQRRARERSSCAACTGPAALYVVGYDGSVRARRRCRRPRAGAPGGGVRRELDAQRRRCAARACCGAAAPPRVEAPCGELRRPQAPSSVVIGQTDAELLVERGRGHPRERRPGRAARRRARP